MLQRPLPVDSKTDLDHCECYQRLCGREKSYEPFRPEAIPLVQWNIFWDIPTSRRQLISRKPYMKNFRPVSRATMSV